MREQSRGSCRVDVRHQDMQDEDMNGSESDLNDADCGSGHIDL